MRLRGCRCFTISKYQEMLSMCSNDLRKKHLTRRPQYLSIMTLFGIPEHLGRYSAPSQWRTVRRTQVDLMRKLISHVPLFCCLMTATHPSGAHSSRGRSYPLLGQMEILWQLISLPAL